MATAGGVVRAGLASKRAAAIAFLRIFIGALWLFEVTVGHNWKIGGFASGANPGWVGPGAGQAIRDDVAKAVEDGTWSWFAAFFERAIVPNAELFAYSIIGLQIVFGLFFIAGLFVRPVALLAIGFDLSVFMLGNSRIPPFFTAAHLVLLVTAAGLHYGADGWLMDRLKDSATRFARGTRFLIDLPLFRERYLTPALAIAGVLALYFFLQVPMRATGRMGLVAMDLAAISGLVAVGLFAARRIQDRTAVVSAVLRIFVGYKFLHEIWVRVDPGVNALPGWAGADKLRELFTTVSENHWAFFSWISDNVFLRAMPFWALVFGVVQLAVGVALVVGWRTRYASLLGLLYVGGLIAMGMTRYAPFVFGLLVVVLALDGGRVLSLDATTSRVAGEPRYGLPIPVRFVPALVALTAANAVSAAATAFSSGITPDAYVGSMGAMTTAMVAILSGLFAFVGILQSRAPIPVPDERRPSRRAAA